VHVVALVHEPLVAPGESGIVEDQEPHAAYFGAGAVPPS
jgi:hypothetical protein